MGEGGGTKRIEFTRSSSLNTPSLSVYMLSRCWLDRVTVEFESREVTTSTEVCASDCIVK